MRYYLPKGLTYNLIDPGCPAEALASLKSALQGAIQSEDDWGLDYPAGPTIRWFEYSHGNVGGGKAWALTQALALAPGKPSPFFEALDNATQDGANLVRGSGNATSLAYIEGDIDPEWQEVNRIGLVLLAGGDVYDVPVFFGVADTSATCPFAPEIEGVQATWAEHFGNQVPKVSGGVTYYENIEAGQRYYAASEWFPYYMAGAMQVISVSEYRDLVVDE